MARCFHPPEEISSCWVTKNGIPLNQTPGGADEIHQEFFCLECGTELSPSEAAERGFPISEEEYHVETTHTKID